VEYWSQKSAVEAFIAAQQLVKTCFHGKEYVHNGRGTVGIGVF
jgi:hypothetical protein